MVHVFPLLTRGTHEDRSLRIEKKYKTNKKERGQGYRKFRKLFPCDFM